jgi:hypothetical protein
VTATATVSPADSSYHHITCDTGGYSQVYGGGAWIENPTSTTVITESAPSGDLNSWYVQVENGDPFRRIPSSSTVPLRVRLALSARVGQRSAAVLAPFHRLLYSSDAHRLAKL